MATSKRCSTCNKELGPVHCTGCDKYFCMKDFKTHRERMVTEIDKIIEERDHLYDKINNAPRHSDQENLVIEQIDKWQDSTIEKVKQVAEHARQHAIQLLNSKQMKISTDLKTFSEELAHLKETENYVEHDLTRLNLMINQFKQDLQKSTEPIIVELHTKQSDLVDWNRLIYVKEKLININTSQRQQKAIAEPQTTTSFSARQLECLNY